MKRLIGIIITIAIIVGIIYGVKYVFLDAEKIELEYDRIFTLGEMDYAKVGNETTVKLLQIKDNRCKEKDCAREGQFLYKLLVYDNHKFEYVELGSIVDTTKDLNKVKCSIKFEDAKDNDHASFRLTKLKEKNY